MRKRMWLMWTLVFVLVGTGSLAAAREMSVPERMARKAFRGGVDMVTGIIELPMQIYKGFDEGLEPIDNRVVSKGGGAFLGIFRGLSHSAGRVTHGTRELALFWTADQESNQGIGVPFDAKYAWQRGVRHSYTDPTLVEGVAPVGRKLGLGLANSVVGVVEIPNQVVGAYREDRSMIVGCGRGVYYYVSRMLYGTTDVFSLFFLMPNHETTYGYPYTSRWPWGEMTSKEPADQ